MYYYTCQEIELHNKVNNDSASENQPPNPTRHVVKEEKGENEDELLDAICSSMDSGKLTQPIMSQANKWVN